MFEDNTKKAYKNPSRFAISFSSEKCPTAFAYCVTIMSHEIVVHRSPVANHQVEEGGQEADRQRENSWVTFCLLKLKKNLELHGRFGGQRTHLYSGNLSSNRAELRKNKNSRK